MVEVVDVVKGRRVEGYFPADCVTRDLLSLLAAHFNTSPDLLFLMTETGEILDLTQSIPTRTFLFRREELILDDRELAPIGDWKSFTQYPPGDWYLEAFDYTKYQEFTDQYLAPIPGVEKRLFNCQENAKRLYAAYKMHLDRYRALEYAALSRVRAAAGLLKHSRKYLKDIETRWENIHFIPLSHADLSAYKEKVKALVQRTDLTDTQNKFREFLSKTDMVKIYNECKSKLEEKLGKSLNLITRLRDTIRKTKNAVMTRKDTIFTFFEGRGQSEVLTREPVLAVTVVNVRSQYTRFRDLLAKLLNSHAAVGTLRSIAETLGKGFDVMELEQEVVRAENLVSPLKDMTQDAAVENDRSRQALNQTMDNASIAVSRLKIKLFKRQAKILRMIADLDKYRNFISIPDLLVELTNALEQETMRAEMQTAVLKSVEEQLKAKITTEVQRRQEFQDTYGAFIFPSLFPDFGDQSLTSDILSNKKDSPCHSAAFLQTKAKISKEIEDLEMSLLTLSQDMLRSKERYEDMLRDRQSFIQLQHFCSKGPKSHALTRELSGTQMEYLDEASKLSQCL